MHMHMPVLIKAADRFRICVVYGFSCNYGVI